MEKYIPLLEKGECVKIFSNRDEQEIYLESVGYNDFHFVKPFYLTRTRTQYTFHFVLSGKGILNINGKTFNVSRHQIFALNTRCTFSYYPDLNDPWEYVWFDFKGSMAEQYFTSCGFSEDNPITDCAFPQLIVSELSSLLNRELNKSYTSYFDYISAFYKLISTIGFNKNDTVFFYQPDYVEDIKRYIELKFVNEDFTIENLAKQMHISHSHLCKIFKKHEGVSVIAYVNSLRLIYASKLLQQTKLSAREIAFMSGFREYEHFLKSFKKKFGITTSEFRENLNLTKSKV